MAVVTVGSIFDAISRFEGAAEDYFADLRDRAEDDGVRLVTHYLARRKQRLPHVLSMANEADLKAAINFPVLVADHQIPDQTFFDQHRLESTATADALFAKAILFSELLLAVYNRMVDEVQTGVPHGIFRSLQVSEQSGLVELKKMRAMNYF